ncbi:hypothetical protein M0R45_009909 [Rubus argutus]|uniref:DUF241 domain protein n=1 Tax=Rubus argutus TaxID=59490 RepID=A0AAW1Y7T6_RUBAR
MAYHTRSNSFPSRPHPIIQEVDEHLCRLRLLQLPLTQQALSQETHQKWVNKLLDGSLRLLDVCSTAKDALLQTKECIQDLQSIFRRRRGDESGVLSTEVSKYLTSRKRVKKAIHKAMGNLKGMEKKSTFSSIDKDQDTIAIVSKLRDAEAVTLAVFESVLSFISGPKSNPSGWSLVSRIVQSKRIACAEETKVNEFAEVDAALKSLKSADDAENQLNSLKSCIQDQEEGLECLFRQLIKTRVSLLNIINH